jgi:hypothetical protein
MSKPGGGTWVAPVSVAVAANQAYSGSDAVFIADSGERAIFWHNDNSSANANVKYRARITGDGTNTFGGTWQSGARAGQPLGMPIALAVLPLLNMDLRMYVALSTGGVVYYSAGSSMQPLGAGGANGNGGCPFAAPSALNEIKGLAVSPSGNLYMAGKVTGGSAQAMVCKRLDSAAPYIFLDGEVLVSNALDDPTGIAVSCS